MANNNRGISHDVDVKAAVMAALLAGASLNQAAKDFPEVPISTIKRWKREAARTVKMEKLTDLLIQHLSKGLEAASTITAASMDSEWLSKQRGSDRAAILREINASIFRIAGALDNEESNDDDSPETNENTDTMSAD